MKEELLKGLTPEQVEKVKACKSQEELLKIAKEEGIELTDEQLEVVNGGFFCSAAEVQCPNCHAEGDDIEECAGGSKWECKKCHTKWGVKS